MFHPNLDEENKQKLLTRLIPQAVNMFDYVKEHYYDYQGTNGDTIYEITYNGRIVKINLSGNADWHLKMILEIAENHPDEKNFEITRM